jgi:hypothetical protein
MANQSLSGKILTIDLSDPHKWAWGEYGLAFWVSQPLFQFMPYNSVPEQSIAWLCSDTNKSTHRSRTGTTIKHRIEAYLGSKIKNQARYLAHFRAYQTAAYGKQVAARAGTSKHQSIGRVPWSLTPSAEMMIVHAERGTMPAIVMTNCDVTKDLGSHSHNKTQLTLEQEATRLLTEAGFYV